MNQRELHQHDLTPAMAARVVAAAAPPAGSQVLEVGPGTGALTAALLAAGCSVAAIELDRARGAGLRERFADELADGRLRLQVGDATVLHPDLAADWRVVANPPFNRTAALLRRWLLDDLPGGTPAQIDLVLQREAGVKAVGSVRGHTRTSVLVELWGRGEVGDELPRDAVTPPSHVPLGLLKLIRRGKPLAPARLQAVDRVLEAAFAGPHTVRGALRTLATPPIIKRNAKQHRYDADDHPRLVPPAAWLDLADYLTTLGRV